MIFYSKILDLILKHRVLSHLLYWVAIIVVSITYGIGYGEPLELAIILEKISIPIQILATYLFLYIQLPLLYVKRYLTFFISFLVSSYIFHVLLHINNDLFFGKKVISYHTNHTLQEILRSTEYYLTYMVDIYMVVFVTAGIKLIKDNLKNKEELEKISSEKAKKEYQYLQSRLQPEFLLNTLNLIEKQSKNNNELAAQSIADLSEVLDYNLYKSDETEVPIMVEYRQIELMTKLIVSNSENIEKLNITQNNLNTNIKVKPMSITKVMDHILNQLDNLNREIQKIIIEVTTLEKTILLDIQIPAIIMNEKSINELKSESYNNTALKNTVINIYTLEDSTNIQIELN